MRAPSGAPRSRFAPVLGCVPRRVTRGARERCDRARNLGCEAVPHVAVRRGVARAACRAARFRVQLPVPARVVVLVSGSGTLLQALLRRDRRSRLPGAGRRRRRGPRRHRGARPRRARRRPDLRRVGPRAPRPRRVERRAHRDRRRAPTRPRRERRVHEDPRSRLPEGVRLPDDQHPSRAAARLPRRAPGCRHARLRRQGHRRDRPPGRRRRGHRAGAGAGRRRRCVPATPWTSLHERIKIEERRLLVGTVAALARETAPP